MNFFASGNDAVDQLGQLNISGNVTPQIWYEVILTDYGKPNYLAIVLLSEIVYWYRPTEVRDERTGNVLGWKKRFKDDLLQKSYDEYAKKYGESKKTIQRALTLLETMGLIKRVFRNVELASGYILYNVMYIDLNVSRLKEITFPDETTLKRSCPEVQTDMSRGMDNTDQGVWTNLSRGMDSNSEGVWTKTSTGMDAAVQTNTYTTSANTTENSSENSSENTTEENNIVCLVVLHRMLKT